MTPSPDSFSLPDPLVDLPPLDPALGSARADENTEETARDVERLSLGERLVVSVSAFFSTLADRSHMAESPTFFETGRLSATCVSFRRDAK
jgi:hypothetical protein